MTQNKCCLFFGKCGGCLYQDLSDEAYAAQKSRFIGRAFADHGLTICPEPMLSIPPETRRRTSFAYADGRLGYNASKSHAIVEVTECRLLRPEITSFLPKLRLWVRRLGGRGDIFVRTTDYGLDIHIKAIQKGDLTLKQREMMAEMAADPAVVRLICNGEPIAEKIKIPLWPEDFLQPSAEGEDILVSLMLTAAGSPRRAADLFCGAGTFTRPLLKKGVMVIGYDSSDSVLNLKEHGVQRDLFRNPLLPEEMKGLDLIVMDPPRAGARAQTEQIALTDVPKIIMISCAPGTAARDCRILTDHGWKITRLVPVDQFKWSNHIEIVCILEKNI